MKKLSKLAILCIISAAIFCVMPFILWFLPDHHPQFNMVQIAGGVSFIVSLLLAIIIGIRNKKDPKSTNGIIARLVLIFVGLVFFGSCIVIPARLSYLIDTNAGLCENNLRLIEHAKSVWASQNERKAGDPVNENGIAEFITGGMPTCPKNGVYTVNMVDTDPECSIHSKMTYIINPNEN